MIRGTTAPFKFDIPYPWEEVTTIVATFWQKHNNGTVEAPLPIKKIYYADPVNARNDGFTSPSALEVYTNLTPWETLRFSDKEKAYVQIQVYYADRNVTAASPEQAVAVYPVKNDEPVGGLEPSEAIDDVYIFDAGEI